MITITNKKTEGITARLGADKGEANYWITSRFAKRKNTYDQVLCCTVESKQECKTYAQLKTKYPTTKIGKGIYDQSGVEAPSDLLLATLFFINSGKEVSIDGIKIKKDEEDIFNQLIDQKKVWLL